MSEVVTFQDNTSTAAAFVSPQMVHILAHATRVRSHREFFGWLQGDVQSYIPHHTLLTAWGDLSESAQSQIEFDVSSTIVVDATRSAALEPELPLVVRALYAKLAASGGEWFLLRGREAMAEVCGSAAKSSLLRRLRHGTHALLLHNVRCSRAGQDCIYVFLVTDPRYRLDPLALDVLLPHLDRALRRVDTLPSPSSGEEADGYRAGIDALSNRECEVLAWLSEGKSNEEIGVILGISHNTVKNHLKRIFAKLGVSARSQAAYAYATVMGSRRNVVLPRH